MNSSNNNNWMAENPLFKNKDQRYYNDFGTGNKIEREDVKQQRKSLLGSTSKPQNQKKDDFLEGFNDPYGEKREQERQQKFADIRANEDKRNWYSQSITSSQTDPFLEGFNRNEDADTGKNMLDSLKIWGAEMAKNTQQKGKEIINKASSWANNRGFFDDVTNAFFKASDLSQDYPFKKLPTDLAHQIISNINQKENQKMDLSGYEAHGGYINDQNSKGSQSGKVRYGSGTFNENGCEIIAVNNALVSLGNRKDIREISKDFETDGQALFGELGTSPYAIGDYFKKQGYQVETFTGDKKIYNLDIPDADTYIISFWNSDEITSAIHTVSMDKLPNGKYRIYNENGRKVLDVDSFNKYLRQEKRVPLVLHCIKRGR